MDVLSFNALCASSRRNLCSTNIDLITILRTAQQGAAKDMKALLKFWEPPGLEPENKNDRAALRGLLGSGF